MLGTEFFHEGLNCEMLYFNCKTNWIQIFSEQITKLLRQIMKNYTQISHIIGMCLGNYRINPIV